MMSGIQLGKRKIAPGEPLFIIAEAGVNHNGDLGMAKGLIDVAAEAGADAVKFQTFKTENIILHDAPKANYHIETTGGDEKQSWFNLLKSQELDRAMHKALIEHCEERNMLFLSTPYDEDSIDLLDELDVPLFKVASTDANNIPFLEYMASKGRPMILSTAMSDLAEIQKSVKAIRKLGVDGLVVLQCTGSYPAPADQANLQAMHTIARECKVAVGYSDHVSGYNAAIAAVALGACVYERHFTLNRKLPGPDHRASLEPDELSKLIAAIRETESVLGDGNKRVMPCEQENRPKLRKFIVASRDISVGEQLTSENITMKRTGGIGLLPREYAGILGKEARRNIHENEPIIYEIVEGL